MKDLKHILWLLKQIAKCLFMFEFSEARLGFYLLKLHFLYPSELVESEEFASEKEPGN